ncbi:MAG TPA: thiamine pyrophosphate-dependent enzyme [Limnochordales bacterium]
MGGVDRLEATRALVELLTHELVVAALGNPAYDLFLAGDRDENFYMWGAMGLAGSVGLGLALALPGRRVVVLDGDGAVLMNLNALATIGSLRPANLVHVVWDNGSYDLTGGQPTAAARGVRLAAVARACGYDPVEEVEDLAAFRACMKRALADRRGPWFVWVRTLPTRPREVPLEALRRRWVQLEPFMDRAQGRGAEGPLQGQIR